MGNSSSQNIIQFPKFKFNQYETEKEAETLLWLQELLFELETRNLKQSVDSIISFYDFKCEVNLYQLVFNIIISYRNRPDKSHLYVNLISEICQAKKPNSVLFKNYFLRYLQFTFNFQENDLFIFAYLSLLYNCYQNDVFTFSDIVNQIEYVFNNYSEHVFYILTLFCWFYDDLKVERPILFEKLLKFAKKEMNNRMFTSNIVETFHLIDKIYSDNLENDQNGNLIRKQAFKQLRQTGIVPDSLYFFVRNDDIFSFQKSVSTQVHFDFNEQFNATVFLPYAILHNRPRLIQVAAYFGAVKIFKYLLLNDADINRQDNKGMQTIHYAIAGGNSEIIRILDSKQVSFDGTIQIAIQHHQNRLFEWIIESKLDDLIARDDELYSIIHYAAISNNMNVFMHMIDSFESDDFSLFDDNSSDNVITLKKLFDMPTSNGITPLYYAINNSCFDIVYFLLTSGYASSSSQFRDQNTGLHISAQEGNLLICKLLLSIDNKSLYMSNSAGLNPVQIAVIQGHDNILSLFLKQPDIDINMKNQRGQTLLHLAVLNNHCSCAKIILQKQNVFLSSRDNEGKTPLHIAAMKNHIKCMKLLLKQDGIDVNAFDNKQQTPLHIAINFRSSHLAKLLINHSSIDLNIADNEGILLF